MNQMLIAEDRCGPANKRLHCDNWGEGEPAPRIVGALADNRRAPLRLHLRPQARPDPDRYSRHPGAGSIAASTPAPLSSAAGQVLPPVQRLAPLRLEGVLDGGLLLGQCSRCSRRAPMRPVDHLHPVFQARMLPPSSGAPLRPEPDAAAEHLGWCSRHPTAGSIAAPR